MSFTVQIVRPTEVITIVIFGFMNKNWLDLTCRNVGDVSFHVLYRYLAAAHLTCFQPPRSWCCRGAARRPPPWTGPASPCRPGRSSSWPRTSCWSRPGRPAAGPSEGPLSSAERRDRAPTVRPLLALQPYQHISIFLFILSTQIHSSWPFDFTSLYPSFLHLLQADLLWLLLLNNFVSLHVLSFVRFLCCSSQVNEKHL